MKAIFISYNQSINERVMTLLDRHHVRGFTRWEVTHGRGSSTGEPHYGTHAWPAMNSSVLAIVGDEKIAPLLKALKEVDESARQNGVRAFVWDITDQM